MLFKKDDYWALKAAVITWWFLVFSGTVFIAYMAINIAHF